MEATQPLRFSGDETSDVGSDAGTTVSHDHDAAGNEFNGRVRWVQIDAAEAGEGEEHGIGAEQRLRVAMPGQQRLDRHKALTRPTTMRIVPSVAAAIAVARRPRRSTQARKDAIALRVRSGATV